MTNTSPTPKEFTQYIIDTSLKIGSENLNSHIRPFWASCPFCALDFDIIGHLEDYEEDEKFIVENLSLEIPLGLHKNSALGQKSDSVLGQKIVHERRINFFEQIPTELTQKLIKIYELDFDMFGYQKPLQ